MSKFDKRCNEILNEANGFLGGLAKGINNIGSGINAAKNPFDATKKLIQSAAGLDKKTEEREQNPISAKNPVKKDEMVWCNTPIYSIIGGKWSVQEARIEGVAQEDSNKQNGSFKIKLNDPNQIFFKYIQKNKTGISSSIIVIGDASKIKPTYPSLGDIYLVGPLIPGIEQGLKSWYIVPKA